MEMCFGEEMTYMEMGGRVCGRKSGKHKLVKFD
jgi:hypothetical protein